MSQEIEKLFDTDEAKVVPSTDKAEAETLLIQPQGHREATGRKRDVFIVQPLVPPVQENLVELLLMLDAARGASAGHLTVVMPVSYTHLRAHETVLDLVCRLLLETKNTEL